MSRYQVIGQCAHVRTETPSGRMTLLLFRGAVLPPDVPADQIRHLLSVRLIGPVGGAEPPAVGPAPAPDLTPPAPAADSVPYDDPERVEARSKLPADGSAPHANAGQPVWVEYAVKQGYDFAAVKDTDKAEIRALFG